MTKRRQPANVQYCPLLIQQPKAITMQRLNLNRNKTYWLMIAALLSPTTTWAMEPIDFAKEIAPILQQNCIRCHTPSNKKGDVSLETIDDLNANDYISPNEPEESHLIQLVIRSDNEPPEMPKEGEPLSVDDVALLRRWINEGANWPKEVVIREKSKADDSWWSLQPLKAEFLADDVDTFIKNKLHEKSLRLNSPADRRSMIRRATYDLIGLPPTPDEVDRFVNDPDSNAYEKLIDRLLESPHFGERWGRHWLDVVRFGESNGYERNVIINDLWPFRDYVIRAFNEDKPFDEFIREHLAGDVLQSDQPDVVIGSAFLVAGPYDNVGNQDAVQAAQIRANTIDEMIRATSDAFIGLTVGCARCHDHKFDPILQRDYYAWYATFAGVQHGSRVLATANQISERNAQVEPLERSLGELNESKEKIDRAVLDRGLDRLAEYESIWARDATNRQGTEDKFDATFAKFIRLQSEGGDPDPSNVNGFGIDEFEVWSTGDENRVPINVALAANGGRASGPSRTIEDFPGAYGPQIAIDGKTGERFLATDGYLTIEIAEPTRINRVVFSSARGAPTPEQDKFAFLADYRIEISLDGKEWKEVAHSRDRQPIDEAHRNHRLRKLEITKDERQDVARLNRQTREVQRQLDAIPPLQQAWVGTRDAAPGPFHVFLGGSPQRLGDEVVPTSLSTLQSDQYGGRYELSVETPESERRRALADWIVHRDNPLTPRVLANRLWHYHFGTGIVETPSDFGYMGSKPTHPELLDWLAKQILRHDWHLKPIHKLIMMSDTYRQSSDHHADAANIDGNARLLWRFPPRRLSAEEIRDTILFVAGKLGTHEGESPPATVPDGGPGFRLYRYLEDNVATYVPLDKHGPETYRRAVYHQNARAALTDLMTDFDQPDCAFSAPRRAETTTPLQALTMLNHSFTVDMANALAERLRVNVDDVELQARDAFRLCYSRQATEEERKACVELIHQHGLRAFCRVLFNTSEMIYVR